MKKLVFSQFYNNTVLASTTYLRGYRWNQVAINCGHSLCQSMNRLSRVRADSHITETGDSLRTFFG